MPRDLGRTLALLLTLTVALTGCGDDDGGGNGDGGLQPDADVNEIQAVCDRWNSDRADLSEGTWSGDVASCDAGDTSADGRANALKLVNLYRWLADLPAVTTDPGRDANAQECALMMHANGQLSHYPPSSWTCFTTAGETAAGTSNISSGRGVSAVDRYMIDRGNETTMGHRRWILANSLGAIGLGSTDSYSCMTVVGTGGSHDAPWTAWPPPGIVPIGVMTGIWSTVDDTGWTVQSDSIDLSGAQVTITTGGQDQPVTVDQLQGGFGSSQAIKITPDGWTSQADTTYTVTVSGTNPPIEYDVQFVGCN